jgi:hypothetical protein
MVAGDLGHVLCAAAADGSVGRAKELKQDE